MERINRVITHGKYIMGPEVSELEECLANYISVKHCISVSSGTDSLLIAMMVFGVRPGDEIITTPFSFISSAEMIAILGAKPVFVDIDPRTFNINYRKIEESITPKTRAIVPVSLYGQCADFDEINAIAERYNLFVIEDGAQSFGATYKGKKSCALSSIGSTSFFPSKPLGCYGDGGALFTDDDEIAKSIREIRSHGQDRRYHHKRIGVNGRLDTLQAAVLLAKLEHFDEEVDLRRKIGARYTELLSALQGRIGVKVFTPYIDTHNTCVYAQYTVQLDNRDNLIKYLNNAGIPTAVHYPVPLHLQPAFSIYGYKEGDFPVAEQAARRVVSIPMGPYLKRDDQDYIVNTIANAYEYY